MARLTLAGVTKRFGSTVAVDAVGFDVAEGEFLALLGPSGCGKTTVLRLIAGFERLSDGSISFDGTIVSGPAVHVPAERRRVGIVFQSYALWPHMTVAANVGYPLRVAGVRGAAGRQRVAAALETVGLAALGGRRPAELSGGQRQRVALARCLVMDTSLVLLDEPLANLDVHLRAAMEDEFAAFHAKTGATMVYVTHDQAEAMALADRIAVMDAGQVAQIARPRTLYERPASAMVARFIGEGAVVDATVIGPESDGYCRIAAFGIEALVRAAAGQRQGPAKLCLRPEGLALAVDGEGIACCLRRAVYRGGVTAVDAVPDAAPACVLRLALPPGDAPAAGQRLSLTIRDGWVIPG